MNNMPHRKGFTLIELLMYIGVSTVFLLALAGFVYSTFATYRQSRTLSFEQREIITLSARLQKTVEAAYSIDPASMFGINLATLPGSTVSLHTQNTAEDPIRFSVRQGQLLIQKGATAPEALHASGVRVTSAIFTNQSQGVSTHLGLTITFSSHVGFGLPDTETSIPLTFELKDYAP